MKTIQVVAAIIVKDEKAFATQRGHGKLKGGWEFPGGKIEENETPQQALVREIKEELNTEIEVGPLFDVVEYDYSEFHLTMQCFICSLVQGNLELLEHQDAKWVSKNTIDTLDWLPADFGLVEKLKQSEFLK